MIWRASASVQQGLTPGRSIPGIGGANRNRSRRNQQPIERKNGAVVELHNASHRIHGLGSPDTQLDALQREVVLALAQVGPFLADISHQQIGNRHARIRWFGFVSDQHDVVAGRVLADRFRRNHSGGAVTKNHVSHLDLQSVRRPSG